MDLGFESVGQGVPGQVHGHRAAGLPVLDFVLELFEGGRVGIVVVDGLETGYAATFVVRLLGDMQVQLHRNKVPRWALWSRSAKSGPLRSFALKGALDDFLHLFDLLRRRLQSRRAFGLLVVVGHREQRGRQGLALGLADFHGHALAVPHHDVFQGQARLAGALQGAEDGEVAVLRIGLLQFLEHARTRPAAPG